MNGGEIFSILISILLAFIFGALAMLFVGGKTALNYWIVKISRGKKALIFGKTKFGWRSFVGKKKEKTLEWTFDKTPISTAIDDDSDVRRYMRLDMVFVDTDEPNVPLKLKQGVLYPDDFDPVVFKNILIRAQTRPTLEGFDNLKKLLVAVLIVVVLVGLGVVMIYIKLNELTGGAAGGVI